jgi:hypothetical protein
LRALIRLPGGLKPDLTFLLDVDVEVGLKRRQHGGEWNRLDALQLDFYQRVRNGYFQLMQEEPDRWVLIDAMQPIESVQRDIRQVVIDRLKTHQFRNKQQDEALRIKNRNRLLLAKVFPGQAGFFDFFWSARPRRSTTFEPGTRLHPFHCSFCITCPRLGVSSKPSRKMVTYSMASLIWDGSCRCGVDILLHNAHCTCLTIFPCQENLNRCW